MFDSRFALIARFAVMSVTSALIVGCAASPGEDLDPFGTSVRQVMEAQTYRPGDSTPLLSGDRAVKTLETYRAPTTLKPMWDAPETGM